MDTAEVVSVLDALDAARVRHWIAGGWGVDALVGRVTRVHRDLDLAVDAADLDRCLEVLDGLGYGVETDWLPLRVEVAAPGERWVDVHPVVFGADGHGVQGPFDYPPEAFTSGRIGGRQVPCLSVDQQRRFHAGYELRTQDEHDLRLLDDLLRPR